MSQLDLISMQRYLSQSYRSVNLNKLNGLLAEIDFRNYLASLGYSNRVSVGGWIARNEGAGNFGRHAIAIFPEAIQPGQPYPIGRPLPSPPAGLHTICATFHQIGIHSYYCATTIGVTNDPRSVSWSCMQLGVPHPGAYQGFPATITGFRPRVRRYGWLRNTTNVASVPAISVPEEFSKENLRITFQSAFMAEVSDIDGIFWGNQFTYPIEIKEKTVANDNKLGDWFGLDVGPFVKLAYYAAK